jgi:hypothetical protein
MKKIYLLFIVFFLVSQGYSQLIINEVLYDPSNTELEGDANGDGVYDQEGDSFIEFYNAGSTVLDLSKYQIWDDTTDGALQYTLPPNTMLNPHKALVVFGGGTPTGDFGGAMVLVADTSAVGLNLNNSGEVIVIRDSLGQDVLTFDSDALSNNPNESYTRSPDITGDFVQHGDVLEGVLFSPGTLIDGTPFGLDLVPSLSLKGILDLGLSGSTGKAIHVVATADIADLSLYGIGVANNGGGTDGQEYTFPEMAVSAGDHILVARDIDAITAYFGGCMDEFQHVLLASDGISQNGDDAIELFFAAEVIETFADVDVDGTGEDWEYTDSWAYNDDGTWIYGGVDCTDGATNNYESDCPYPFCPIPDVLVTSITVTGEGGADFIDVLGGSLQMYAEVLPEDASNPSVIWSVENQTGFATISDEGLLMAVGDGTVEVTASSVDGSGVTGSLMVTISNQTALEANLELWGVLDIGLSGSSGKAIHLYTTGDIASLSTFGVGVANNGGGTDGQEYTFPDIAVGAGMHILLSRDTVALAAYFEGCFDDFDLVLEATDAISQNGDDAIELFFLDEVIETFADVDVDGTGEDWEYTDSWAYKMDGEWIYGGPDCTDGAATNLTSACPYPFCPTTGLLSMDQEDQLSIHPNPVVNTLILETDKTASTIYVLSIDGKRIMNIQGDTRYIDVSTLQPGIYFLQVVYENYILAKRFVRE